MRQIAPLEIGIPVIDLDRMVEFYSAALGCEEVRRADIPAELSSSIRVHPEGYVNVWLKFPGGEIVKLVRPPTPPAAAQTSEFTGMQTGIAYFTLYCEDIAEAIQISEEAGAQVISDPALAQGDALKLAFLRDPEGNVFELVEP